MGRVTSMQETPNPDARKFGVSTRLVGEGTYTYATLLDAEDSPLAQQLFDIDGVDNVMIAPDFVTIRKLPSATWGLLEHQVTHQLSLFLNSYQMAVTVETSVHGVEPTTDVERAIVQILDEDIRPAVASDGGEVTFMGFDDGIVKLKMSGACGSCPSSVATLKGGIERLLREEVPEVREVERVA